MVRRLSKEEVRPRYDRELVVEHVRQLHERGVLRDGEFSSRLLEAWLRGVASRTAQGLENRFEMRCSAAHSGGSKCHKGPNP